MQETDYKLSRNNPALTAKVISTLVETIRDKMNCDTQRMSGKKELRELQYLREKCVCGDPVISTTAGQGLVYLVRLGVIQITPMMSELVAMISLAKYYEGIIMVIMELLIIDLKVKLRNDNYECPFNLSMPQHPLISILLQDPNMWSNILNYMSKFYDVDDKIVISGLNELFRPLYLFMLCDPSLKMPQLSRIKFFNFLLERRHYDLNLLFDVIPWIQISSTVDNISYANDFISNLITSERINLDPDFQEFLLLWLTSVLYELCSSKRNIIQTVACISDKIDKLELKCISVLLTIIANCISIVAVIHLDDLMKLCLKLLKKNCTNICTLLTLKACLLNWMISPSLLTEHTSELMHSVYNHFEKNYSFNVNSDSLTTNKYLSLYQNTNRHVHLAVELCLLSESWNDSDEHILKWLNRLDDFCSNPPKYLQTFLCGILLYEHNEDAALKALSLLLKLTDANKSLMTSVLTLILHRLSSPTSPRMQFELLKALPKMGAVKENLHLIISTLKALSGSSMMLRSFALCLFYDLWLCEAKCYPYLQGLMMEGGGKSYDVEFQITKARILKELCIKRPELYGTELAAHLSKILNQSKNDNGIASSLALEGLKYLCMDGVIDIVTAWDTLAVSFNTERRPAVIKSFCDLMGEVPNLCAETPEYKKMVSEVVSKLWWYTLLNSNIDVVESAYKALSLFSVADITNQFSDIYQDDRSSKEKTFTYDNYELVPGEHWLLLLQNGNRATISFAADLIASLASKEISEYGRGIYAVIANRGEPHNYNALPESSIIRALTSYIKQQVRKFDDDVDVACLEILSREYSKPLPPFDWCFLQEFVHIPTFRTHCISLASHQVVLSGTARRFIENFIVAVTHDASNIEDTTCIIKNLKHLCNSIQPAIVKPLLDHSFRLAFTIIESHDDYTLLDDLIRHIKEVLGKEDLHEANRNVLAQVIVTNVHKFDVSSPVFQKLLKCIALLPLRYIRECTAPKQWTEVCKDKIQKAIKVHCTLAKTTDKLPLLWLNEIIEVAGSIEEEQKYVLQEIADVLKEFRDNNMTPNWILELLGQIQVNLADRQMFTGDITFMCNVLLVSIIVLSGYDMLLQENVDDKKRIMFLFPQALRSLLNQEKWNDYISQMLEWLYHLINFEKIPEDYELTFYQALVALRHEISFKESLKWMKYVGCKRKYSEQFF